MLRTKYVFFLEFHQVRFVGAYQSELCGQVCFQHRGGCNSLEKGFVDLLLVGLALVTDNGRLWCVSHEKFGLPIGSGFRGSAKICVANAGDINSGNIDLCRCGDDVRLVYATEWDSIDFVWSRH